MTGTLSGRGLYTARSLRVVEMFSGPITAFSIGDNILSLVLGDTSYLTSEVENEQLPYQIRRPEKKRNAMHVEAVK